MKQTLGVAHVAKNPLTLLGTPAVVGQVAPDFTVTNGTLAEVKLSDFKGKTVILSVFPSIDTGVCATQARTFNKRAADLSKDTVVLCISKDLPFALSRFCGAEGINNVLTLSDYKESEFGTKYGFLIAENRLLYRGIVVINPAGKITYVQYVDDMTHEPDYQAALDAAAASH